MQDDENLSPVEAERLRRMATVWRASPPPARAPARARRAAARPLRVRPLTTGTVLAFLGYAAVGAAALGGTASVVTDWVTSRSSPETTAHAPVGATPHGTPALRPRPAPPSVAPGHAAPEAPVVAEAPDPGRSTSDVEQSASVSAPRRHAARAPTTPVVVPPPSDAVRAESSAWRRAEAALAAGDYSAADRAFQELEAHADPSVRDAASLSRAQLWVTSGQAERARPVLERLFQRGATPIIRKRAGDLLAGLGS